MQIQIMPIESVRPYEHNPRRNDAAVDAVARSLQEFGWQQPVVVDESRVIIAGHTRYRAAIKLGMAEIPVHVATGLSPDQVRAYRIADNKVAELAEWDSDLLAAEVKALAEADFDLSCLAMSDDELQSMLEDDEQVEPPGDPESIPDIPDDPITQPGDLWLLGDHRLLCGDSTNAEHVERLMNGERAGLMNTDPPYGVSYANDDRPNPGVAKPRVANDELVGENLQSFLESCFCNAVDTALLPNAAWYLWHAHLTQGYFAAAAAAAAANVVLHRQIIWVKPVLLLGRGQYHWKHEPCFMGWVKGSQPPDYGLGNGERTQTTVWEIGTVTQQERREFNHATPKPVSLFSVPIVKHTKRGEACFEPFAGTGPQFIAAEQLGRKCYGLEISPQYCDVIVKRWEQYTGRQAVRG